jgi:hypothetical protein
MASVIHEFIVGSRKADGSVNAGGRVYLTRPGTDTRVTAYADRDLLATISLSSGGILLGADGKRAIFVTEPATVREETSDGTHIATYPALTDVNAKLVEVENAGFTGVSADGVSGAGYRTYLNAVLTSLASSLGGVDGKVLGEYGTVPTPVWEELEGLVFNVRRFGAIANGVADDTTAIQAAINAAAANGGGKVFLPAGNYLVSSAFTMSVAMEICGVGAGTVISQSSTTANLFVSSATPTGGVSVFRDFTVSHASSKSSGTIITLAGDAIVSNIYTRLKYANAIVKTGSGDLVVDACQLRMSDETTSTAISNSGGTLAITASVVVTNGSSGVGVAVTGGTFFATSSFISSVTGVSVTATPTIMAGCEITGTTAVSLVSLTGRALFPGCTLVGPVSDSRTGSPVGFEVTSTSTVTPLPGQSPISRITATVAGITVTLGNANAVAIGTIHTVVFVNASGGAVTWVMGSDWILTATGVPTPSTGNETAIIFQRSGGKMREVGTRAITAT